ncbi:MAG: hypothetical protein C0392_15515 [Syntrophus sp. (in: bacteria)]|nr:hypothetical protein [Syntrophus sp. (in: bacteria)]
MKSDNLFRQSENKIGGGWRMVDNKWKDYIEQVDFAFQPIINIHTGTCYGVEALMRDQGKAGFSTIEGFFDTAYEEKCLFGVDLLLREKALKKFSSITFYEKIKLFFNVDNRILLMPDYSPGITSELLDECGLNQNSICFEISERHELTFCLETKNAFNAYKQQAYKIAIYNQMEYIEPMRYPEHSVHVLLDAFRKNNAMNYLPIINLNHEPLGIVREKDLKEYVYSPYGKDLLKNQRLGLTLINFLTKTPVAEILKEATHTHQMFVGHIGGDDFFASAVISKGDNDRYMRLIRTMVHKFRDNAANLYDEEAKEAGCISAKNREGQVVNVPLLTVSAAVLVVHAETDWFSLEQIVETIATLKHKAKNSADKIAVQYLGRKTGIASINEALPFELNSVRLN